MAETIGGTVLSLCFRVCMLGLFQSTPWLKLEKPYYITIFRFLRGSCPSPQNFQSQNVPADELSLNIFVQYLFLLSMRITEVFQNGVYVSVYYLIIGRDCLIFGQDCLIFGRDCLIFGQDWLLHLKNFGSFGYFASSSNIQNFGWFCQFCAFLAIYGFWQFLMFFLWQFWQLRHFWIFCAFLAIFFCVWRFWQCRLFFCQFCTFLAI